MECLICKKTRKKAFFINMPYGAGESTVKDDIIEFVGDSVKEYLNGDQTVCSICLNMLDEIVASKHEVLMAIIHSEKKYTPKLGNLWTILQRKFSEDNYGDLTPNISSSTPPQPTIPKDSTPVMYLSKTKPYNQSQEKYFELRENMKRETQDIDLRSEWSCKTEGRPYNRKDRKAFRSKAAIIQRMRKELEGAESEVLSPQRPLSSTSSLLSFFGNDEDDNKSKRGPKRKRRASDDDEDAKEELDLRCWNRLCEPFGDNLALYTFHRIEEHQEEAYYTCWFCGMEYFTQKHLDIHLKKHQLPSALCGICGTMQKNMNSFQKHIEKHDDEGYDCFLCQLSFLTRKECNSHVFHKHRYRRLFLDRRKQTKKKTYGIVDHIIYKNEIQTDSQPVEDTTANKSYTTIIMDNIYNRKEESFKPMSFKEMYLSQKLGTPEPTPEGSTPQPLSLVEDMVCKGSGTNTFQLELGLEPNVDTSIRNYNKLVNSSIERVEPRSGRSSVMSGRCTPYSNYTYDRSNIPSDDETNRSDITGWSGYHTSRRDLESRTSDLCSEVAHYLDRPSPSQSSKAASPVCEEEQSQSDIETEFPPLY